MKRLQTRLVIEMINSSELPSNLTFKQHQQYSGHVQISNILSLKIIQKTVTTWHNREILKHNRENLKHNRGKFEALPKSIIGKFKSIIGSSLTATITTTGQPLFHSLLQLITHLLVGQAPLIHLLPVVATTLLPLDSHTTHLLLVVVPLLPTILHTAELSSIIVLCEYYCILFTVNPLKFIANCCNNDKNAGVM